MIGFAFAFGWTPCVGPILAVVLGFAAAQDTVWKGIFLLAIYSAGLAVPFLITSLGIERSSSSITVSNFTCTRWKWRAECLLIALGNLLVMGRFTLISGYFSFLNRFAL